MKKIIEKITNNIRERKIEGSKIIFNQEGIIPVPISKNNFKELKENPYEASICFIDGGNAEILAGVDFALHFIRIFSVVFDKGKKEMEKDEFYTLATNKENKVIVEILDMEGNKIKEYSFDLFDKTISIDIVSPNVACSIARRFLEIEHAINKEADIIVVDGSLQARVTGEEKLLKKLKDSGKKVVGFSKTSNLLLDNGLSAIHTLIKISPFNKWYYFPLIEGKNEKFFADLYIVKLHENSKFAFRVDIFNIHEVEKVLSLLSINSNDSCFLGYPYGLIFADRFARVSNKEKNFLKAKFGAFIKKEIETSIKLSKAHDILDSM